MACAALLAAFSLLAAACGAQRVLYYNVGGDALGKFCGDPDQFLVDPSASYHVNYAPYVGKLGALGAYRALADKHDKLEFNFPVPAGNYTLVLGFAEVEKRASANGSRVFAIEIQGAVTAPSFDVFHGVGRMKPLWRTERDVQVFAKGLSIAFVRGSAGKPFVSVIEMHRADGKFLNYPVGSSCKKAPGECEEIDEDDDKDHQAHAVTGEAYVKTDFNDDGYVSVLLDGTKSHSHYFDPKKGISGSIAKYEWKYQGEVIGREARVSHDFPVGKSIVTLSVTDNMGDVSCANTEIIGQPATDKGAYCYFYPGVVHLRQWLNAWPKPRQGVLVRHINWPTASAFPFIGKSSDKWTVRCITHIDAGVIGNRALQLNRTGRVALYANYRPLITEGGKHGGGYGGDGVVSVSRGFRKGMVMLNIVYHKKGKDAKLVLLLNGTVVPQDKMRYFKNDVIPVLKNIEPAHSSFLGGGKMQLFGNGFFNNPQVYVGKARARATIASPGELLIEVPSQAKAGSKHPIVVVRNKAGQSNYFRLSYTRKPDVRWKRTFWRKKNGQEFKPSLITSIALGPDFNYYLGSQSGYLWSVSVSKRLVVLRKCISFSLGRSRSVLGVAFNPRNKVAQPYVTTSTLFRNSRRMMTPLRNKVKGWANGKVQTLIVGCKCFCRVRDIVTGLPVSNKDHTVNKMVFLPNGDMLLTVGGGTNAGHNTPGNPLGGQPETPLSASVLLVKTSKGDDIDGNIRYNQYKWPSASKRYGGKDVEIYATGLRNSFGITRTLDGKIYATDNAPNVKYGHESTSCTTQVPFVRRVKDELNMIIKGAFYGHANRNQGHCVWGKGRKPIAEFLPSTNGVLQYQSNAFFGNLKFDLITTEFATGNRDAQGSTSRVIRKKDGTIKTVYKMEEYSGLAAENGIHGEIVMPRVARRMIAVLQPDYVAPPGVPFVVAVTPKMGTGKQLVLVSGNNFKRGLKAYLGGKRCTDVQEVRKYSFKCVTPEGKGLVAVTVINPDGKKSPTIHPKGDFSYL